MAVQGGGSRKDIGTHLSCIEKWSDAVSLFSQMREKMETDSYFSYVSIAEKRDSKVKLGKLLSSQSSIPSGLI